MEIANLYTKDPLFFQPPNIEPFPLIKEDQLVESAATVNSWANRSLPRLFEWMLTLETCKQYAEKLGEEVILYEKSTHSLKNSPLRCGDRDTIYERTIQHTNTLFLQLLKKYDEACKNALSQTEKLHEKFIAHCAEQKEKPPQKGRTINLPFIACKLEELKLSLQTLQERETKDRRISKSKTALLDAQKTIFNVTRPNAETRYDELICFDKEKVSFSKSRFLVQESRPFNRLSNIPSQEPISKLPAYSVDQPIEEYAERLISWLNKWKTRVEQAALQFEELKNRADIISALFKKYKEAKSPLSEAPISQEIARVGTKFTVTVKELGNGYREFCHAVLGEDKVKERVHEFDKTIFQTETLTHIVDVIQQTCRQLTSDGKGLDLNKTDLQKKDNYISRLIDELQGAEISLSIWKERASYSFFHWNRNREQAIFQAISKAQSLILKETDPDLHSKLNLREQIYFMPPADRWKEVEEENNDDDDSSHVSSSREAHSPESYAESLERNFSSSSLSSGSSEKKS